MVEPTLGSYLVMGVFVLVVLFGWWVIWEDHRNRNKKKEGSNG